MRYLFVLILTVVAIQSNAQLYLSGNVTHVKFGLLEPRENFYSRSKNQLYLNDYYSVRLDVQSKKVPVIGCFIEPSYLRVLADFEQHFTYSNGGGSSPASYYKWDEYARVNVQYLGIKLGPQFSFKTKPEKHKVTYAFSFSLYVHLDQRIHFEVLEHVRYNGTSMNSNNIPQYPSYFPNNALNATEFAIDGGLEIRNRIEFKGYFVDIHGAIGVTPENRFERFPDYNYYPSHPDIFTYRVGVGLGYLLKRE